MYSSNTLLLSALAAGIASGGANKNKPLFRLRISLRSCALSAAALEIRSNAEINLVGEIHESTAVRN